MNSSFDDLDLSDEELQLARSLQNTLGRVAASAPVRVPPFESLVAHPSKAPVVFWRRPVARRWVGFAAAAAAVTLLVGVGALSRGSGQRSTDLALETSTPRTKANAAAGAPDAPDEVPEVAPSSLDVPVDNATGPVPVPVPTGGGASEVLAAAAHDDAQLDAALPQPSVAAQHRSAVSTVPANALPTSRATTPTTVASRSTPVQRSTAVQRSSAQRQQSQAAASTAAVSVATPAAVAGGPTPTPVAGGPTTSVNLTRTGVALSPYGVTYSRSGTSTGVSFSPVRLPGDSTGAKGEFPATVLAGLPAGEAATSSLNGLLRSDLERFASELATDSRVDGIGGSIGRITITGSLIVVERLYEVHRKDTTPAIDAWPGALVVDTQRGQILEARDLFTAAAIEEMASRLADVLLSSPPAGTLKPNAAELVRTTFRAVASDNRACCAVAPRADGVLVSLDGSYVFEDASGRVLSTLVPWSALEGLVAESSPVANRMSGAETFRD